MATLTKEESLWNKKVQTVLPLVKQAQKLAQEMYQMAESGKGNANMRREARELASYLSKAYDEVWTLSQTGIFK